MDNGKKNTSNVLSTNDIRKHARNWTLAGDVGLLAHLEQFSQNIINKTEESQKIFDELVDDYETLYTKVGNITNQFLALQNCQFVENRVYDEETPTEEKTEVKVQNDAEQEKLLLMQYKEAVEVGIKLLDTHFQEIQLPPNSDSDEEDDISAGNSVIWKPKNPYAGKKFPLLIGSAEWWADDNVGLGGSDDTLDSDKVISESESDMESMKSEDKRNKSSSSSSLENIKPFPKKPAFLDSSENLFGLNKNDDLGNDISDDLFSKGADTLLEKPENFLPDFEPEPETEVKKRKDSLEENQMPEEETKDEVVMGKPKKVDDAFTRELMAKLVSVTNKSEPEVKEKEQKKAEVILPPKREENLFDETDDSSDLFSTKVNRIKELPASSGLFFDAENDDELFKGENDLFAGSNLFESNVSKMAEIQDVVEPVSDPKRTQSKEPPAPEKNSVKDLFDDLDDEDTLFLSKPVSEKPITKSLSQVEKEVLEVPKPVAAPRLGWSNDEGLFDSINTEIDDGFFDSSGLFDAKKDSRGIDTHSNREDPEPDLFKSEPKTVENSSENQTPDTKNTKEFKEQTKKKLSILDLEDDDDDDLFSKSFAEEKKLSVKVMPFPDDEDTALFLEKPKPADSVSVSSSRSSLFDDVSASKSRLASVFEKDKTTKPEEDIFSAGQDTLFGRSGNEKKDLFSTKVKEKVSLFDDCDDGDDDDLFGAKIGGEKSAVEKPNVFEKNKKEKSVDKNITNDSDDLFKDTPTKLRATKSDTLGQTEKKLFVEDMDDGELFGDKTAITKPKPPSSLSLRGAESETKGKTFGKLNIPDNLKVRFESVAKNISPGGAKPLEKKAEVKSDEFLGQTIHSSNLLKCPSKDRVKIPGKRRPQSRKARQEAIRNSGTWDQPTSLTSSAVSQPSKETLASPIVSNPLSPSTDEEDFFKVPELDTNFEKEDQSIFKSDLFESAKSSKLDDSLLFDGAPVLSPLSPIKAEEPPKKPETEIFSGKSKPVSIFGDDNEEDLNGNQEDDDESLFKTSKPKTRDSGLFAGFPKSEEKIKKPLFGPDLDDDDEDLFGGKSHSSPLLLQIPQTNKPKEDGQQKDKGNSNFVDPLGLVTKD